ncbi:hypothetical protein A2U94_12195 [Bacillus sp. VT 712]|uniref:hypothetical protein n=1 Tax=Bacillaceae TaxID=186817 RepID=UPI0007A3F384|nr:MULTISPECIES: hypothetical protein [Bacillaceae]KZB91127.1 hypothetical protein A2U94_12195 [Bacillus sp. VT 712]
MEFARKPDHTSQLLQNLVTRNSPSVTSLNSSNIDTTNLEPDEIEALLSQRRMLQKKTLGER